MTGAVQQKYILSAEEEAYQHIHRQIRLGTFAPGQRLVTETVADQIGTSRMPVRSALRRLASEGLVEIRANRGAVVKGLSRDELFEVFEMRAVLEGLAIRNAVGRMTPAHLRRLTNMMAHIEAGSGDYLDWTASHQEFHEFICSFCEQPRLLRQLSELHATMEPYMRLWASQPDRQFRMGEAHQELIDALHTGDPALCEAVMRQHIMNTVSSLEPFLQARP